MQNKYLINFAKRFWLWFWKKLMNGFAPSDIQGNYKRPKGILIDQAYDSHTNTEKTYLLVGNSCPWCHRTLLVYTLKKLSRQVKVIFLEADINSGQWVFNEKFKGCKSLNHFYKKASKNNVFRPTLPLLFNFHNNQINVLSNESSQIVSFLGSIKNESSQKIFKINNCDKDLLKVIQTEINDGVYKCGFARNQVTYEKQAIIFLKL